jgi:hypothetical protein
VQQTRKKVAHKRSQQKEKQATDQKLQDRFPEGGEKKNSRSIPHSKIRKREEAAQQQQQKHKSKSTNTKRVQRLQLYANMNTTTTNPKRTLPPLSDGTFERK